MKLLFDFLSCMAMVAVGIGLIYACALQLADVLIWLDNAENAFYMAIFASLILAGFGTYWAVKRLKRMLLPT